MQDVVIVAGIRTPVGSYGGSLKSTPVVQLGALVLKETLKQAGLRPVCDESVLQFEPDALRGRGMIELEQAPYDEAGLVGSSIYTLARFAIDTTNSSIRNTISSFPLPDALTIYQFGSPRGDDACFVFLDTRVKWISYDIDKLVFRRLCAIADRGVIPADAIP